MNKKRLGVALCGSYCTYGKLFPALEGLAEEYELVPIMSDAAAVPKRLSVSERRRSICQGSRNCVKRLP